MSAQYVVVYFAGPELEASAVGPFRSIEKARRVTETLKGIDDNNGLEASGVPQLVELETLGTAINALWTDENDD